MAHDWDQLRYRGDGADVKTLLETYRVGDYLEAFEENRRAGRMAFSFKGEMVDAPHLARARRTLERAEQLTESRPTSK